MKDFQPLFELQEDAQEHEAPNQDSPTNRQAKALSFTPFVPSEQDDVEHATVPLSQGALEMLLKEREAKTTMHLEDDELEALILSREGMNTPVLGLPQTQGLTGQEGSNPGITVGRSGAIEGISKTKPGQTGKDIKIKLVAAPDGAQPETLRMSPSLVRKLSTSATPLISMDGTLAEDTSGEVRTLFRPTPQTQKPQGRGQNMLIAITLGVVFVLVGVVLGWMVLQ